MRLFIFASRGADAWNDHPFEAAQALNRRRRSQFASSVACIDLTQHALGQRRPRIDQRHAKMLEVALVARRDACTVCRCDPSDEAIGDIIMTGSPLRIDLGDRRAPAGIMVQQKDAGTDIARQEGSEVCSKGLSTATVRQSMNAEHDLVQRHRP